MFIEDFRGLLDNRCFPLQNITAGRPLGIHVILLVTPLSIIGFLFHISSNHSSLKETQKVLGIKL